MFTLPCIAPERRGFGGGGGDICFEGSDDSDGIIVIVLAPRSDKGLEGRGGGAFPSLADLRRGTFDTSISDMERGTTCL